MMLKLCGPFGCSVSLDFRKQFGEPIELSSFQFVISPIEFRLTRNERPLQDWQTSNTDMYDLQHGPGVAQWARDNHWFINDLDHRHDVLTCGLLSQNVKMETRGLGFDFLLLVWLRDGTWHATKSDPVPNALIFFHTGRTFTPRNQTHTAPSAQQHIYVNSA